MRSRDGSVLLLLLLCIAAGELIAAGSLVVATRAARAARHQGQGIAARAAAEAAVRSAIASWDRAALDSMMPGDQRALPGGSGTLATAQHLATVERLSPDRWLVRGEGTVSAGTQTVARARSSALVVTIPLDTLWLEFAAALGSGADVALAPGGMIDGLASALPPPPWTATDCPPDAVSALQRRLGSITRPGVALAPGAQLSALSATVTGLPPVQPGAPRTDSAAFERLGAIPLADLTGVADRIESGTVSPAPALRGGACDASAPGNWGAPLQPSHPCADYFPLVLSSGDLTLSGGAGQGVLVVDGDLNLASTVFYGAVLVTGAVSASAATVHGALRASGGTATPADLHLRHSACALWRAFLRGPALRRAWRPPGRWWLPPF